MPVSTMSAVERIARVLAGWNVSANGEGQDASAGDEVDLIWPKFRGDAVAVLKTLREPDAAMASAGDPDMWERMIEAALTEERAL